MQKYLINPNQKLSKISKEIYGTFSEHLGRCIYEGVFVGKDSPIPNVNGMRIDVVEALKDMGLPVLRWPGGCFADEYHWKDGIGPLETRKHMINTHWGGVVEDNSFGTHEFFELCRQLGAEAYITGNVGSGSVQEMSEWIEYMTFDGMSPMSELREKNGHKEPWEVKYFGIGNENWGCGGNMRPEYYADEYRRYNTYVRDYKRPEKHIQRIACGPNAFDYEWTRVLMERAGKRMDGLSLHYYTSLRRQFPYKALEYSDEEYIATIAASYKMEELLTRHGEIMNQYDPEKKVALVVDEWGTWFQVEEGTNPGFLYQQSTIRDAVVAALNLNLFNKHSDRVRMANIAQTINVLQAVALTDGEKMILTPTYFIFKMFKDHAENTLLGSYITTGTIDAEGKTPQLIESASVKEDGTIVSTIVNTSLTETAEIALQIADFKVSSVEGQILAGAVRDHNSFEEPDVVGLKPFTDFALTADGCTLQIPPCATVKLLIS